MNKHAITKFVIAFAISLATTTACAVTFTWNDPSGGLFDDPANWTPAGGPPGNTADALFNLANTYTVTFQSNVSNATTEIDTGVVTFQLSGTSYASTATVGSVAEQTGRLTITNGSMTGDMALGNAVGATGFFTIDADATYNDGGLFTTVGDSGIGTLTISNGGRFSGLNGMSIGNLAGSNGTLSVSGVGSTLAPLSLNIGQNGVGSATISSGGAVATGPIIVGVAVSSPGSLTVTGSGSSLNTGGNQLTVGSSGSADLTVSAGATASVGILTMAATSTSTSSILVTGAGSTLNSTSGALGVGQAGSATLNITSAGTINSVTARLAPNSGSVGSATVSGTGSTWNTSSLAIGGALGINGGTGTLSITAGGVVNVAGTTEVRNSSGTSLTINGGTLNTVDFNRVGTLNLNDGTLRATGIFTSSGPLTIDGNTDTALPTLRLSGNAAVNSVTTLTIGNTRQGALILDGGRVLSLSQSSINIGASGTATGTITLSGSGTQLTTFGGMNVGGTSQLPGGSGTLNINPGATADVSSLTLYSGGTINLNGGTLKYNSLNALGGKVNFNSGILSLAATSATLSSSQLDLFLGQGHTLGFGKALVGAGALVLNGPLNINGGSLTLPISLTVASTLQLSDGTQSTTSNITINSGKLMRVSGTGALSANTGITNNGTFELDDNLIATSGGTFNNSGTLRGSGFVGNSLSNTSAGQVQLTTGNRLEFSGNTNTNSGTITLAGGELQFNTAVTNSANTGLITAHDAITRFNGGLTNNGSLATTAGTTDVYGDVTNNVGGKITVSGGGLTNFYDDVTIAPGAANVQVSAGGGVVSKVVFFGSYNGGTTGGGIAFIEGDHKPGNSPALVDFGGAVSYGSGSHLFIELGGTTPATTYDQVHAAGLLSIAGTLNVSLINGFTPALGNSFNILKLDAGLSGFFSSLSLPALDSTLGWNTTKLYTSGILSVVGINDLPGDWNRDKEVTGADLPVMLQALTDLKVYQSDFNVQDADLLAIGDLDNSGVVNNADLQGMLFLLQHGLSSGPSPAAVPEPAAGVLFAIGLLSLLCKGPWPKVSGPPNFGC